MHVLGTFIYIILYSLHIKMKNSLDICNVLYLCEEEIDLQPECILSALTTVTFLNLFLTLILKYFKQKSVENNTIQTYDLKYQFLSDY